MGLFDWMKKKDEDSGARRDRGKPDFSNVRSGSSTRPAAPQPTTATPAAPGVPPAGGRSYTVQGGDSLWKIAERHYGDGNQWRRIYEANRGTIDDPDVIHPGQELAIP